MVAINNIFYSWTLPPSITCFLVIVMVIGGGGKFEDLDRGLRTAE